MLHNHKYTLQASLRLLPVVAIFFLLVGADTAQAQDSTSFVLRPYCENGYEKENTSPIGTIPAPGIVVQLGNGDCGYYKAQDPQTLKAGPFAEDEIIEMDIMARNIRKNNIVRARAWLDYDPNILEGISITIGDDFSSSTPGESDFNDAQGQVRIEAVNEGEGADMYWVRVATVKFRVKSESSAATVVSFYDVQSDGHTTIIANEDGVESDILESEPSSLLIGIGAHNSGEDISGEEGVHDTLSTIEGENDFSDTLDTTEDNHLAAPAGSQCTENADCEDNVCYGGVCRAPGFKVPTGGTCERDNQCQSLLCQEGVCADAGNFGNGEACIINSDCQSDNCEDGFCGAELQAVSSQSAEAFSPESIEPTSQKLPTGGACIVDFQCESSRCIDGACASNDTAPAIPARPNPINQNQPRNRTAFGLIQIRGLELTSEGESVFLRWNKLDSSEVKGYNIYYGTTKGQYIQRKTIPVSENTITIRNLPKGNRYYFAVRGIGDAKEESAFSKEVSIVIGDPDSSTNPLVAAIITKDAPPKAKPIRPKDGEEIELPGETGLPSPLLLVVILSALAGTLFAGRRQLVALSHSYNE